MWGGGGGGMRFENADGFFFVVGRLRIYLVLGSKVVGLGGLVYGGLLVEFI